MFRSFLTLGIFMAIFPFEVFSGEFVANCESRAASRDDCFEWAQQSSEGARVLCGETAPDESCRLHPGEVISPSHGCVHSYRRIANRWLTVRRFGPRDWLTYSRISGMHARRSARNPGLTEFAITASPRTHRSQRTAQKSISICGKLGGERESLSALCSKNALREPINIKG